ncbi:MAG: hypothetical protein LZF61_07830 [Nitrosomonas sp.]|nr:MAG: hypothetical protein LZF61_07830 [Nitrosomonas sp.]
MRSSEGISFVAGLGYQLGIATSIQTEATNSHGISTLVDALAVQAVYAKLAPSITETQLNSVLDALRFIALGVSINKTDAGDRDALYANLKTRHFRTN